MKRRDFIALVGGATAWPFAVRAQQAQPSRIGVLVIGNADVPSFGKELREGLRELGRIEGQHYVIEFRSAEGQLSRLPELAAELVRLKVDVIVALFTPCAFAAKQATREIPIVILSGDPLGTGLVQSLANPGANITGLSQMGAETHGKCVELFRDMLPSTRRVALIANAADPVFAKSFLEQAQRAGAGTSSEIAPVITVRGPEELEAAFATAVKEKAGAVVFQASLPTKRMVELALAHRLPAATIIRGFAETGGLMSYGSDGPVLFKRAATFVHKVLRGEKPANIPVEQAVKFELVINLKTARAIGLTVPAGLLARADEVIE
ncbi:ABC transporter substrate-binding protein [Bradyrhizobium sp. AUGA SZCCT0431]|uniref:ABC transporter substrate-binding protein n=1 Tax=Bradyrhizobium sp. AUGA SZCCT0431 TaxID=2807674 RepID=UPI001BADF116|nr:ABC transporter substrate-binding protein [Bradyrhizobium sp. AUGA SZCCT0431]MBR1143554.1 ABC transporter substrate-binding protein [Bradyrhizobium sp. AUGA SZCCT0431]